jgi:hypothetical protein
LGLIEESIVLSLLSNSHCVVSLAWFINKQKYAKCSFLPKKVKTMIFLNCIAKAEDCNGSTKKLIITTEKIFKNKLLSGIATLKYE